MRIGRSRMRPASSIASRALEPRSTQLVGILHQQDRVLGHQPDQQDHADLAVEVDGRSRQVERHERTGDRQRHGHEHRERVDHRLELRGQHHEHHEEGQHEREVERGPALRELARLAGEARCSPRAAALPSPTRFSESSASPSVKPGARPAESVNDRTRSKWLSALRADAFLDVRHGAQLHQLAVATRNVEPGHVVRRGALGRVELHDDVVELVVPGEGADPPAAQQSSAWSRPRRPPARPGPRPGRGRSRR